MTIRLTLRLPENLYDQLISESRASKKSLNMVIVERLRKVDWLSRPNGAVKRSERWARITQDLSTPWDERDDSITDEFLKPRDDEPLLTHEQLRALMPVYPPDRWLSKDVIDDREDRI